MQGAVHQQVMLLLLDSILYDDSVGAQQEFRGHRMKVSKTRLTVDLPEELESSDWGEALQVGEGQGY